MKYFATLVTSLALLLPAAAQAGCELEYKACDASCSVKHFSDDAAKTGCVSKCVAEKGLCLAKEGAGNAAEAGGEAWEATKEASGKAWDATSEAGKKAADSTKSFFKGLTEE